MSFKLIIGGRINFWLNTDGRCSVRSQNYLGWFRVMSNKKSWVIIIISDWEEFDVGYQFLKKHVQVQRGVCTIVKLSRKKKKHILICKDDFNRQTFN